MTRTTSQAMAAFLEDITVTDYQKTSIINARKDVVIQILTTAFPNTSDLPFWKAILMGSAAKGTIVRPIDDIDALAVFSAAGGAWNKYQWDSKSFIYRITRAYDGLSIAQVGTRGQAVRVFFKSGGHVDVAPVFYEGDEVYLLPNGTGDWIKTAPTIANDWYATRQRELEHRLSAFVRLLKKWNITHSKRLRSYHLETMAATMFASIGSNRQNALTSFFEWAPKWIDLSDPGGQSGSLSGYLTGSARRQVVQSFGLAYERATKANAAEVAGDHEEAQRLWRLNLGSAFPN